VRKVVYELRSVPNQISYESVYNSVFPYRDTISQKIYEMANKVALVTRGEFTYNLQNYTYDELKDTCIDEG
jgi:hypothetical protein